MGSINDGGWLYHQFKRSLDVIVPTKYLVALRWAEWMSHFNEQGRVVIGAAM